MVQQLSRQAKSISTTLSNGSILYAIFRNYCVYDKVYDCGACSGVDIPSRIRVYDKNGKRIFNKRITKKNSPYSIKLDPDVRDYDINDAVKFYLDSI